MNYLNLSTVTGIWHYVDDGQPATLCNITVKQRKQNKWSARLPEDGRICWNCREMLIPRASNLMLRSWPEFKDLIR